ncbi:MAG: hypothetical protein NT080_00675 [Spirochaetes bacterium]|nr:hypothetical protein [Spirochaetota bacterium]
MEEIVTTDALEREILEDARKKAAALLKAADEEARRVAQAGEKRTKAALAGLGKESTARIERHRSETEARIPLEKSRLRTTYLDDALRSATRSYFAALPDSRIAEIAAALLSDAKEFLKAKAVSLRCRGLGAESMRALGASIPWAASVSVSEDPSLPASGAVAETGDGAVTLRATMDVVASDLLREKRGELAAALCGKATEI